MNVFVPSSKVTAQEFFNNMQWYHYALLTAVSLAAADTIAKKASAVNDEYTLALARMVYAIPFVIPVIYFTGIPELDSTFFIASAIALPADVLALILYQRAIKLSPLSLSLPMLSFTPVFVVATSFMFFGEIPDKNSLIGIGLVCSGLYFLNLHDISKSFLEPLKSLKKEKGARLMFLVALIFSININIGKIMANHSNPVFLGGFYIIALTISLLIYLIISRKTHAIKNLNGSPILFLMIGIFLSLSVICHFIAVTMTNVAYMVSVKRTSILFSIIFSAVFLREIYVLQRFFGAAIMLTGVWFIIVL